MTSLSLYSHASIDSCLHKLLKKTATFEIWKMISKLIDVNFCYDVSSSSAPIYMNNASRLKIDF